MLVNLLKIHASDSHQFIRNINNIYIIINKLNMLSLLEEIILIDIFNQIHMVQL